MNPDLNIILVRLVNGKDRDKNTKDRLLTYLLIFLLVGK